MEFLLDPSSWLQGVDDVVSSTITYAAHAVSALLEPYLVLDDLLSHSLLLFFFWLIVTELKITLVQACLLVSLRPSKAKY
jgi:hypothetical protein